MKFKMNALEKKWVLYDVGNSAFTLLVSTIMPIYFNALAGAGGIDEVDYLAYWGYATSIATALTAILGPTLGTLSDNKGRKKYYFMVSVLIGAIGCVVLGFMQHWLWFLLLFCIAKTAYSVSLVFYDSMLVDVTTPERMDEVSSQGYAWGYIGSCIPFIMSLVLVLMYESLGMTQTMAMILAFILITVWWIVMTLPLLRSYKQVHFAEGSDHDGIKGIRRLGQTFKELKQHPKCLLFLVAFFFFIDGVYTIIDMATAYGTALGFDTTSLLLALLLTQIVAFPAAIFFGKLSNKYPTHRLMYVCIAAYLCIAIYAIFMVEQYQFWILAVCVGLFQGAIQSLSRSYFAKIIPTDKSGQFFGIYDICGKGASLVGTTLVSVVAQITNTTNLGIGSLVVLFALGLYFFYRTNKIEA